MFYEKNIGFYVRGGIRNPMRNLLLQFDEKDVELRVVKDQNLSSNYFHASNHFSMTISQRISLPEMQITPSCNYIDFWPFASNNRRKREVSKNRLEKSKISHERDTSPAVLDFISSSPKNFKIETAENGVNHKKNEKQHPTLQYYFSPHTRLMHDNII